MPIDQRVSSHYIIKANGEIVQLVDLSERAWHATYYNDRSIGVEMVGFATEPASWNPQNLESLANLVAYLVSKYSIELIHPIDDASSFPSGRYTGIGLIGHSQIQPGNNGFARKTDPGVFFPWTSLVELVRAKMAASENRFFTVGLSVIPTDAGVVSGGGRKLAYTDVSVNASPRSGYSFVNWTENGSVVSNNQIYGFVATKDRSLVANFEAQTANVVLNVTSSPLGGGLVTGVGSYPTGASLSISATAAHGYRFVSWTENGGYLSGSLPLRLQLNSNRSLVANFASLTQSPPPFEFLSLVPSWDIAAKSPKIVLIWTQSSGVEAYDLYRDGRLHASGLAPSTTTLTDSSDLVIGQSYIYRLVARNNSGARAIEAPVTVSLGVRPALPDLEIVPGSFTLSPGAAFQGDRITIGLKVQNSGKASISGGQARIALRSTTGPSRLVKSSVGLFGLGGLAAADSQTVSGAINTSGIPAGSYILEAILEPPAGILEESLINNEAVAVQRLTLSATIGPNLVIAEQPQSVPVAAGDILEFRVRAEGGVPPYSFKWRRDGNEIEGSGNIQYRPTGDGNGSALRFLATPFLNQFKYSVAVTDAVAQTVYSNDVTPRVFGSPTEISEGLSEGALFDKNGVRFGAIERPLDRDVPTFIIVHGWQALDAILGKAPTIPKWTISLHEEIEKRLESQKANIAIYRWDDAWSVSLEGPAVKAFSHGSNLKKLLQQHLGWNYDKPIHLIGHSLGTIVVAQAASELTAMNRMQVTTLEVPTKTPGYAVTAAGLGSFASAFAAANFAQSGSSSEASLALAITRSLLSYNLVPLFFDPSIFDSKLSHVEFVDNFYGTRILPIPATGEHLKVASENWSVIGSGHSDVHEQYETLVGSKGTDEVSTIVSSSGLRAKAWTSIVLGMPSNRYPMKTGVAASVSLPGTPIRLTAETPENVEGTRAVVRGQTVNGLRLSAGSVGSRRNMLAGGFGGVAPFQAKVRSSGSITSVAKISTDIRIPDDATEMTFDLLVERPGFGAWLSVSLNGRYLFQFRCDAFSSEGFRPISIPVGALSGQSGLLSIALNSNNSENSQVTLANFEFKGSPAPVLRISPISQNAVVGGGVVLTAAAAGIGPLSYQWRRNGVPIRGAIGTTLTLTRIESSMAGSYDVVIANGFGAITSGIAVVTVAEPLDHGRISNLSIRSLSGSGSQTLIVGLVVGGVGASDTKAILLRGVGPSLEQFGVANFVADPRLSFYAGNVLLESNDNWGGSSVISQASSAVGAFPFFDGASKDSAIRTTVAPGAYSVQISGPTGVVGTALAEIYDATPSADFTLTVPRFVNVSARTQVGTGGDIAITGLVVSGKTSKSVLIRAIGPTLAKFGVDGVLEDPILTVFKGSTVVGSNDNWSAAANGAAVSKAAIEAGAFALPFGSKDAAAVFVFDSGAYTIHVSGVGGTTGVSLIEIYEVP